MPDCTARPGPLGHPTGELTTRFQTFRRRLLTLAALAVAAPAALAQAYPSRPVTLIVPWPAGGSTDRHLRALAEIASKHLGQQIVVQNQPGRIDFGSTGTGTSPHLLIEEVSDVAKVQLNHIPFKGNADLMQALLGGHVMSASDATGWDKNSADYAAWARATFTKERAPIDKLGLLAK